MRSGLRQVVRAPLGAVLFIMVVALMVPSVVGLLRANSAATSLSQYLTWRDSLTTLEGTGTKYRVVHSSGGVAAGVISEGQGYGLLISGLLSATLPRTDSLYDTVIQNTYEFYLGWRQMCMMSNTGDHCQENGFYCKLNGNSYPCLAHWKFNDQVTAVIETGAAPDGDQDSILGMILLLYTTEDRKASYPWWNEMANWAYDSIKALYDFETAPSANGNWRILRLGSCWGGFDCNNPSYHAPANYRVFRNYMQRMAPVLGRTDGSFGLNWNKVVQTTYRMLEGSQCPSTGLVPNWYKPNDSDPITGDTSCSGSGTPADQYGSEASRTVQRVVLDYIWFGDETLTTFGPFEFASRVAAQTVSHFRGGTQYDDLSIDQSCLTKTIFPEWLNNGFLYGPTFSSLVVPLTPANSQQQGALEAAGTLMKNGDLTDYFGGSWIILSNMIVNGDFAKVRDLVRQTTLPSDRPAESVVPQVPVQSQEDVPQIPTPALSEEEVFPPQNPPEYPTPIQAPPLPMELVLPPVLLQSREERVPSPPRTTTLPIVHPPTPNTESVTRPTEPVHDPALTPSIRRVRVSSPNQGRVQEQSPEGLATPPTPIQRVSTKSPIGPVKAPAPLRESLTPEVRVTSSTQAPIDFQAPLSIASAQMQLQNAPNPIGLLEFTSVATTYTPSILAQMLSIGLFLYLTGSPFDLLFR